MTALDQTVAFEMTFGWKSSTIEISTPPALRIVYISILDELPFELPIPKRASSLIMNPRECQSSLLTEIHGRTHRVMCFQAIGKWMKVHVHSQIIVLVEAYFS